MAESPSQAQAHPVPDAAAAAAASEYWCYQCEKRVAVETLADLHDVVCVECKNGFVESRPAASSAQPSPSDQLDDPALGSQFLQVLRLIAQAARDEDVPPPPPSNPLSDDDFLRIELDGWDNDEDEDEDDDDDDGEENEENSNREGNERGEGGREGDNQSDNENGGESRDEYDEDDARRRRRDVLRLRIRDFATRGRSGRNRILDWAEILMGLDDSSIELRLEVPESDRYIGNPEDYVDDAGYQALLQNLAESDSGRRGAPPAAKSAILELPTVEIRSKDETLVCAICKDMVSVGEMAKKLPCGHGYHGDCIVPWLGARNTCPVCRFELPTDDPEYEEEKKKKMNVNAGGSSGSVGDNSLE
ncbi:E3 ubiquitin-protein ligase CIP8 [Syzygium oleosum]|uniref:E3 ubiquitin-protein ligase CIP8 n=1 Tax=Syzygium oleosum TaxID=219896 RepID=UPI0011D1A0E5|nr:E3 ubiquitin-protein ligase CIP8 [Syzygium oleosum]